MHQQSKKAALAAVKSFEDVDEVLSLKTMHLSSDEVLVALEIDYRDQMTVDDLERINVEIEGKIKEIIPQAKVYLEASKKEAPSEKD